MNTITIADGQKTTVPVSLVVLACCECGMPFGMTEAYRDRRRNDHGLFHCPAGHPQHFTGKSKEEKLAAELEWQKRWTESESARADRNAKEAQSNKFKAMAERGHKVRLQKRIAAGVCPCCTRSFQNVARHMADMHPDFKRTEAAQ